MGWQNLREYYHTEFYLFYHEQIQDFLHTLTGLGPRYQKERVTLWLLAIPILIGIGSAAVVNTVNYANTLQQVPASLQTALQSPQSSCSCNLFIPNQKIVNASLNTVCTTGNAAYVEETVDKFQDFLTSINQQQIFLSGWQGLEATARGSLINQSISTTQSYFSLISFSTQVSNLFAFEAALPPNTTIDTVREIKVAGYVEEWSQEMQFCLILTPANITLDLLCPSAQCVVSVYPSTFSNFSFLLVYFVCWAVLGVLIAKFVYFLLTNLRLLIIADTVSNVSEVNLKTIP